MGRGVSFPPPVTGGGGYRGEVANEAAMLALSPAATAGQVVKRVDLGTLWTMTGTNPALLASWTQGGIGPKGDPGATGPSAYAVAVSQGFSGSEAAWLASLKGDPGTPGTNGTNGTNGANGQSAYALAVAGGYAGTQAQWLASLQGADGESAYALAVSLGFVGTEAEWLLDLQGPQGVKGDVGPAGLEITPPIYAQELPGAARRFEVTLAATGNNADIALLANGALVYGIGVRSLASGTSVNVTLRGGGSGGPVVPGVNGRTLTPASATGADVVFFPAGVELLGPVNVTASGTFTTAVLELFAVPAV